VVVGVAGLPAGERAEGTFEQLTKSPLTDGVTENVIAIQLLVAPGFADPGQRNLSHGRREARPSGAIRIASIQVSGRPPEPIDHLAEIGGRW
jgi:hypothetical protein